MTDDEISLVYKICHFVADVAPMMADNLISIIRISKKHSATLKAMLLEFQNKLSVLVHDPQLQCDEILKSADWSEIEPCADDSTDYPSSVAYWILRYPRDVLFMIGQAILATDEKEFQVYLKMVEAIAEQAAGRGSIIRVQLYAEEGRVRERLKPQTPWKKSTSKRDGTPTEADLAIARLIFDRLKSNDPKQVQFFAECRKMKYKGEKVRLNNARKAIVAERAG